MGLGNYYEDELLLEVDIDKDNEKILVLYNDDYHTFDFVIDCLVEICKHDSYQAEQCAWIVHHKGKCDIKSGSYKVLKPMKEKLADKELKVSID